MLQCKLDNVKQELTCMKKLQHASTVDVPQNHKENNSSAFSRLFWVMINRLDYSLQVETTENNVNLCSVPTVNQLAQPIHQRASNMFWLFCCKGLRLKEEGEGSWLAAQTLLVDRHWLTTSSSEEFSRAAATLSLSASCLFTAQCKRQKVTQQESITKFSSYWLWILTVILSKYYSEWKNNIPASSDACVPGVMWTSIWVEAKTKH